MAGDGHEVTGLPNDRSEDTTSTPTEQDSSSSKCNLDKEQSDEYSGIGMCTIQQDHAPIPPEERGLGVPYNTYEGYRDNEAYYNSVNDNASGLSRWAHTL